MDMQAWYRRFTALRMGTAPNNVRQTHQESLAVAQVEPPNFEMTRAARRFYLGNSAAATGIAPVQAIPTTAAQWVIWNPDTIMTYFFEEILMVLASGTPGLGGSMWGALISSPALTGSSNTGLTTFGASSSGASKAIVKSSVTIATPAAPAWYLLADNEKNITAAAYSTGYTNSFGRRDLAGALAIQPSQGLALAVVAPSGTTPLYIPQARWIEQETDME